MAKNPDVGRGFLLIIFDARGVYPNAVQILDLAAKDSHHHYEHQVIKIYEQINGGVKRKNSI